MSLELPEWFTRAFAVPRMAPYLKTARRDGIRPESLYLWNLQVSEAFYAPLHCLEISLRNALHDQLRNRYRRSDWWQSAPLAKHDASKVDKAAGELLRKGVRNPCADDIVAELSLGFWVSLLSRRYDRHLWVPALHKAFPSYGGNRESLRDSLQAMLLFRNRIMHHEPIHHRHLTADHAKIYLLLGYLEPELAAWLRNYDRVPGVLAKRPGRDVHDR
jgi:hypothetical protein